MSLKDAFVPQIKGGMEMPKTPKPKMNLSKKGQKAAQIYKKKKKWTY